MANDHYRHLPVKKLVRLTAWLNRTGHSRGYFYDHRDDPDYPRSVKRGKAVDIVEDPDGEIYLRGMAGLPPRGRPRKNNPEPIAAEYRTAPDQKSARRRRIA